MLPAAFLSFSFVQPLCPVSEPRYPTPNKYPLSLAPDSGDQELVRGFASVDISQSGFGMVCLLHLLFRVAEAVKAYLHQSQFWCLTPFTHRRACPSASGHISLTTEPAPLPMATFRSPQSPSVYQRPPCWPPSTKVARDFSAFVMVSTAAVNISV